MEGRLDLLCGGLLKHFCKELESRAGLKGFAEKMDPFINEGVKEGIGEKKVKLPKELELLGKMLFGKGG